MAACSSNGGVSAKAQDTKGAKVQQRTGKACRQHRAKEAPFRFINSQIIAASETGGIHQLMAVVEAYLPQMNLINLSTAIHRLAKMTANDYNAQAVLRLNSSLDGLLAAIHAEIERTLKSEAPPALAQCLSNVTWSLATMRLVHRKLVGALATLAAKQVNSFKPYELSTALWALAKLNVLDDAVEDSIKPLFSAAALRVPKVLEQFEVRCLSMMLWAFAKVKQNVRLFSSIGARMVPMIEEANCQELANTAWAFGTVDIQDPRLFRAIGDRALRRLHDFKPQELSSLLWGFGSNRYWHEALFTKALETAKGMDNRWELQTQHLANILWAFARVQPQHRLTRSAVLALLPSCIRLVSNFKPQEVASATHSVAKAFGIAGEDMLLVRRSNPVQRPPEMKIFFEEAAAWASPNLKAFSDQSLANIASAFACVDAGGTSVLFAAIADEVTDRVDTGVLEPKALLQLLKGIAGAPWELCAGAVRALLARVAQHLDSLHRQERAVVARICATLLGVPGGGTELNGQELHMCCTHIASGNMEELEAMTGRLRSKSWVSKRMPGTGELAWTAEEEEEAETRTTETPNDSSRGSTKGEEEAGTYDGSTIVDDELGSEDGSTYEEAGSDDGGSYSAEAPAMALTTGRRSLPDFPEIANWKCSVKNSFIHVAFYTEAQGDEAGEANDFESCCCYIRPLRHSKSTPNFSTSIFVQG